MLRVFPDPVLRTPALEVEEGTDLRGLEAHMREVMAKHGGVGLAAPQVGTLSRVVLVGERLLINPRLVEVSEEEEVGEEGCLSLPGIWLPVRRPVSVRACWQEVDEGVVGAPVRVSSVEHDDDGAAARFAARVVSPSERTSASLGSTASSASSASHASTTSPRAGAGQVSHRSSLEHAASEGDRYRLVEAELTGQEARIFQHELDHLDGVLTIDRVERDVRRELYVQLLGIRGGED